MTRKEQRHNKTVNDFKQWLARNPTANLKRRVGAFNAIADSNYEEVRKQREDKIVKKLVSRI